MPASTKPVRGGHKDLPTTSADVLNVACARSSARRDALSRMMRDISRLTCSTARDVASVLVSAGRKLLKW